MAAAVNVLAQEFGPRRPVSVQVYNTLYDRFVAPGNDGYSKLPDNYERVLEGDNQLLDIFAYITETIRIRNFNGPGTIMIATQRNFTFFLCYYVFVGLRECFTQALNAGLDDNYYLFGERNGFEPFFTTNLKAVYNGDVAHNNFEERGGWNTTQKPLNRVVIARIRAGEFSFFVYRYLYTQLQDNYRFYTKYDANNIDQVQLLVSLRVRRRREEPRVMVPQVEEYRGPDNNVIRRRRRDNVERNDINIQQIRGAMTRARTAALNGNVADRTRARMARSQNSRGNPTRFFGEQIFFGVKSLSQKKVIEVFGVGANPFSNDGTCFSTSLLMCQIRFCHVEENRNSVWISLPNLNTRSILESRSIRINVLEMENIVTTTPFSYSDGATSTIVIGNPVRFTEHNKQALLNCAQILELYIEDQYQGEIDSNSWSGIPQAFADLYGVIIHIFDHNFKGRVDVIYPKDDDFWSSNLHKHIYLYKKEGHIYPVVDISTFLNKDKIRNLYQLCDYCQFVVQKPAAKCFVHVASCKLRRNFLCSETVLFSKKLLEVKPFYRYYQSNRYDFKCNLCMKNVNLSKTYSDHVCFINQPKAKERISDEKIFVLDIEAMQDEIPGNSTKLEHKCVLICMRSVYQNYRKYFDSVEGMVNHIKYNKVYFGNALFIAHNGGGYDYPFFVKYFEESGIEYDYIPRPGSKHKYLEITMKIDNIKVRFIDFMMLVPDSLKNIGKAFQLDVQKGDFPHRFLNSNTLRYVGRFPPLFSPEDYFSYHSKKSVEDQNELVEWYNLQCETYCTCEGMHNCQKRVWNAWEFLLEYCWMDVNVLAEACKKYRNLILSLEDTSESDYWRGKGYDPFLCITQSQLAMHIFLSGFNQGMATIYLPKQNKPKFLWESISWLESLIPRYGRISHRGNSESQFYVAEVNVLCDGVCSTHPRKTVFLYLDCEDSGCLECNIKHSFIKKTVQEIYNETMEDINKIKEMFEVVYIWNHEYLLTNPVHHDRFDIYTDREMFYGGRTEVFSPYANSDGLDMDIKYHDVCSMYPYVCAFETLPVGTPTFLYGDMIQFDRLSPDHPNKYFGYAKIKVTPPRNDYLGLLPSRGETGRLTFHLLEQVGYWHTCEIYLAMENGYVVNEIYQVIQFEPEERSSILMRGYMEYFMRLKVESDGWKKMGARNESPTEEEKDHFCEVMYQQNGCIARPRKDKVQINPVLRKIAKIFLNCLWGKFCQVQNKDFFCDITSCQDLDYLLNVAEINQNDMKFRMTNKGTLKTCFTLDGSKLRPNNKYNIFIAASVTAYARCILHRRMLMIGTNRILYCDTDSILFLYPRGQADRLVAPGLGNFTDEYAGKVIKFFYAIAPKFYFIITEDNMSIKSKGIWLTQENKLLLNEEEIKNLLRNYFLSSREETEIVLKNMSIFSNTTDRDHAYATMFTRYNTKRVTCQFSKRVAVEFEEEENLFDELNRINLYPIGFDHN